MRRYLPPLNALRVFEVAGRTENFSKAAAELFITQSAVSKQIRILEENLNAQLFSRDSGSVQLTPKGKQMLAVVVRALDSLEDAAQKFYSEKHQESLTINITPSMSAYWMFERVESFSKRFPDIALYIDSDDSELDWAKTSADLAIRVMPRTGKQSSAELLIAESLVLVAAPSVLKKQKIETLDDILKYKLISNNSRENLWENFFRKFNLETVMLDTRFGCQHTHMTVNAALQGFGLALAPRLLCEKFLKNGQLLNPLEIEVDSGRGYYLQAPSHKKNERKVRLFHEWIQTQLTGM